MRKEGGGVEWITCISQLLQHPVKSNVKRTIIYLMCASSIKLEKQVSTIKNLSAIFKGQKYKIQKNTMHMSFMFHLFFYGSMSMYMHHNLS